MDEVLVFSGSLQSSLCLSPWWRSDELQLQTFQHSVFRSGGRLLVFVRWSVCVCVECVVAVLCGCICLPLLFAGVHLLASSSAPPPPSDSPCSGNKHPQPSPASSHPLSASLGKPAVPLFLSSVPPSLMFSAQKAAWSELKRPLVQFKLYQTFNFRFNFSDQHTLVSCKFICIYLTNCFTCNLAEHGEWHNYICAYLNGRE